MLKCCHIAGKKLAVWQPTCTFATSRLKSTSISYLHIYIIVVNPYRTAKLLLADISRYVVVFTINIFFLTQAFWWYGYNASWYVDDDPPAVRPGSASLEGKTGGEVSGDSGFTYNIIIMLRGQDASCDIHVCVVSFPDPTLKERKGVWGHWSIFLVLSIITCANPNSHMIP